jgi:regulator of sigma E protease
VFNLNLAILNMMPCPLLDGGHITMAIAEAIRRKPPQGRLLEYVQTACALMLFGFIIFVTLKDTGDFFGGGKPDPEMRKITTDGLPIKDVWLSKEERAKAASGS